MDQDEIDLHDYVEEFTKYCTDNLYKLFDSEEDIKIADAVLEIFRKRGNIQNFNKKALYIFVKEIIDVQTIQITPVVKVLKKVFYSNIRDYLENKTIHFEI
jgi:hypothetical protein